MIDYLRGFATIVGFLLLGVLLHHSGVPIPGGVAGLLIFYLAMSVGLVKLRWVERTASLLLHHMTLLFVPLTVGLMDIGPVLSRQALAIIASLIVSTSAVVLTTGLLGHLLLQKIPFCLRSLVYEPSTVGRRESCFQHCVHPGGLLASSGTAKAPGLDSGRCYGLLAHHGLARGGTGAVRGVQPRRQCPYLAAWPGNSGSCRADVPSRNGAQKFVAETTASCVRWHNSRYGHGGIDRVVVGRAVAGRHVHSAKSVTTPIAIEVCLELKGIPQVTIAMVILAGVLGAGFAVPLLRLAGVRDDHAIGAAMGTSAHGIGTASLMGRSEMQATVSSWAMAAAGVITSLLARS